MGADERVRLDVEDGLARLRLVRSDAHNAIDPAMVVGLDEAISDCATRSGVRALLVTANGPSFTVGGDLDYFAEQLDTLPAGLEEMIGRFHAALQRLWEFDVPVVCSAQGAAAGGGLGLLWCADFVVAADDLKVATGFARIGLSGDGGSTWHLPRLVGLRRARQLIMGGEVLDAAQALEWGLVDRVVPAARLEAEALALARELADGATVALGAQRRLLRDSFGRTLAEQLAAELEAMARTGATTDAREGISAFGQRRAPRFHGS